MQTARQSVAYSDQLVDRGGQQAGIAPGGAGESSARDAKALGTHSDGARLVGGIAVGDIDRH